MATFADRLREEIEYMGITRKELAYKANVKKRALDMYLGTQGSMPPADAAVRIAKALNVTVEYLVTGERYSQDYHQYPSALEKEMASLSSGTRQVLEKAIHLLSENEKRKP